MQDYLLKKVFTGSIYFDSKYIVAILKFEVEKLLQFFKRPMYINSVLTEQS